MAAPTLTVTASPTEMPRHKRLQVETISGRSDVSAIISLQGGTRMQSLKRADIMAFLLKNGLDGSASKKVMDGFDLAKPVYEQRFEEGQELFQYIRLSTSRTGNWFALPGATTQGVAIIDGGAGRRFHRFRVERAFTALEGSAKDFPLTWKDEIGGKGGATQIYVPPNFLGHLTAVSPAERP